MHPPRAPQPKPKGVLWLHAQVLAKRSLARPNAPPRSGPLHKRLRCRALRAHAHMLHPLTEHNCPRGVEGTLRGAHRQGFAPLPQGNPRPHALRTCRVCCPRAVLVCAAHAPAQFPLVASACAACAPAHSARTLPPCASPARLNSLLAQPPCTACAPRLRAVRLRLSCPPSTGAAVFPCLRDVACRQLGLEGVLALWVAVQRRLPRADHEEGDLPRSAELW